jgi:glucosyl-dolichyl phosphate glucuronosyltransferase
MEKKVSIVICTFNRSKLLENCLESLSEMDYDFLNAEILVIDNNSTDNTLAIVKKCAQKFSSLNIRYVKEEKQGIGNARTKGALEAKGEIIAYIDDDCKADTNWIKNIVQFYENNPLTFSTGGCIIPNYNIPLPNWYGKYFWGLVGYYNLGNSIFQMKGKRYPSGANMHFRKEAFEKYGYFDGNLGRKGDSLMAGEEKAMYLKLIYAKEKVYYLPSVKVYHFVDQNKFHIPYVKKHSMGIGGSERLMNSNSNLKLIFKLIEYIAKLGYAIVYGIGYLLKGQPSKMVMLTKFRWWVIIGFLFPKKVV